MANLILILLAAIICSVTGSLVYLGDIEGKAFYEESSVNLNWTEAHSYCLDNRMRLAKIESMAQADFLASVVTEPDSYWVSSKTNTTIRTYSWNNQGVNLTYSVIWTDSGDADVDERCAYFELWSILEGLEFFHVNCRSTNPITLCEDDSNSTVNSLLIKRPKKLRKEVKEGLHQNLNFTYLGDVEDKSFYSHDGSQGFTWEQAYRSCEEGNMSLARVESDAQANFLTERLEDGTEYWIAIKNVDEYYNRHRTYNLTGAFVQVDFDWAEDGRVDDPTLACGIFYFIPLNSTSTQPALFFTECSDSIYNFLCHVNS